MTIDLKDAYLQVPIHQDSRKFLRFVAGGKAWQFRVLCFGLATAPQLFTRVMAPITAWPHCVGIRLLRYLDDWLILASSWEEALQAKDQMLHLCHKLCSQTNLEKSSLVPQQVVTYLGMRIDSVNFKASPSQERFRIS